MSHGRVHIIARPRFVRCRLVMLVAVGLLIGSSWASAESSPNEGQNSRQRTWRSVSELSAEELVHIDFSTDTPRDASIPY